MKLNPTLLGPDVVRPLLNETLGFDIEVPDLAFEHDPRFDAAMRKVAEVARRHGKAAGATAPVGAGPGRLSFPSA